MNKNASTKNRILISVENLSIQAELNNTSTAQQVYAALPFEGEVNVWGDEIYFEIPVKMGLEPDAGAEVEVGDLAYWPTGFAFCIFFGPTPVSSSKKPRAYSPVNVFGQILGEPARLKTIASGSNIQVSRMIE